MSNKTVFFRILNNYRIKEIFHLKQVIQDNEKKYIELQKKYNDLHIQYDNVIKKLEDNNRPIDINNEDTDDENLNYQCIDIQDGKEEIKIRGMSITEINWSILAKKMLFG
jgi:hypothetical protein